MSVVQTHFDVTEWDTHGALHFPMWDKLCFIELNWTKTASAWMSSDRPCQRNLMKYRKYHMDRGLRGQTARSDPEFDQNSWEVPRKWTLRSCRVASSVPISKWNHCQTLLSLCVTLSGCWCWMIQHIQHVSQNTAHSCPTLPLCQKKIRTHPDLSELAVAETLDELQRLPRDLPHVFGFDGQVGQTGHAFVARHDQSAAQPRGPSWIKRCSLNFKRC